MNSVDIRAKGNGIGRIVGTHGYMRFQGDSDPNGTDNNLLVPLSGGADSTDPVSVSSLQLTFVTGGDNLGDNGNQLEATLNLADGTTIFKGNLNNGGTFDNYSTHIVNMPLPTPVLPSTLVSLHLHTTNQGGVFGDNWDMASADIRAEGDSIDRDVGSSGFFRFMGDSDPNGNDNNLTIPLTGGPDGCIPAVVLTNVPAKATLTYCGGPLHLSAPAATDTCSGAAVGVSGSVTSVNGASTSLPVNTDGTFSSPISSGTFVVTWTSTNATGAQVSQTQTVTLVDPRTTVCLWTPTTITACAAGTANAIPLPTVDSQCSGAQVTGSIVSAGGMTLSSPIPIESNGLASGEIPVGNIQVIWSATDSSGVVVQAGPQTFQLTNPPRNEITQLPNGDMKYSVGPFATAQAYVEAFVVQNGVQNISGNIVASQVRNPDGTFSYSRVAPAAMYHAGDVIDVRFYAYAAGKPGVFFPGPVANVSYPDFVYDSTSCPQPPRPAITEDCNGAVEFTQAFGQAQQYVEAFVKVNGTQVAAGNIVQSGVISADGNFSYHRVLPASSFRNGDQVQVRFYSYVAGQPGVFTPGPTAATWYPTFTYGPPPSCGAPPSPPATFDHLTFRVVTGSDDLRADSVATAVIAISGQSPQTVTLKAQTDPAWAAGSTHTVTVPLASPVPLASVGVVTVTLTSHDGPLESDDNWAIQSVNLFLSSSGTGQTCLFSGSGTPFVSLTGSSPVIGLIPLSGC
jgi:hypothetical protein